MAREAKVFARAMPLEERYDLASQLRRAANSVALNIAEGFGVGTTLGTLRHLRIARGSLFEVDAALELAMDAGYGEPSRAFVDLIRETDRVLQGLIRSMQVRHSTGVEGTPD